MKPRRAHVAPPLRERLEGAKASRQRERELAISSRLAAAQSERRYAQERAERSAEAAKEANDRLRDLASVLPENFIGLAAAKERLYVSSAAELVRIESLPQRQLYLSLRPSELLDILTVDAVQVVAELHYDDLRQQLHAVLQIPAPGAAEGRMALGYAVSIQALKKADPQALASIITREMRPAVAAKLAEFQRRARGAR